MTKSKFHFNTIEEAVAEMRNGRMVILVDDEDRENEGDLIVAAEAVTPEIITFFSSEACGLICMPITEERARRLQLPLMVRHNRSQHETNFTVSIDATERTTGRWMRPGSRRVSSEAGRAMG